MATEYYIGGGTLFIEKKAFVKEVLSPDSIIKKLLNYELNDIGKTRSISVDKSDTRQILLRFNSKDKVFVGERYDKLLQKLKKGLKEKIKGKLNLIISDPYEFMTLTLDFDSEGEDLKQYF